MSDGWHVTSDDIVNWANTNSRQAQEKLPLLIRKLIFASVSPTSIRLPAGNDILMKGYDVILRVEKGDTYVPVGDSVWELSTEEKVEVKANGDYSKRSADPLGVDKTKTTFVIVTCRKWPNSKEEWLNKKACQWFQIKALDAVDLETWLEQCSAVHLWFARLIGKMPEGAWDAEKAWDSWRCSTKPPCNADLVLAGRIEQAEKLKGLLEAKPDVVTISAESRDEAYAFALAAITKFEEFLPRLLVVKEAKDWDILVDSLKPLILIPQFDNLPAPSLAPQHGHCVILPLSSMQLIQNVSITLNKPDSGQQANALVRMGIGKETAEEVIEFSRGNLNRLRRHPILAQLSLQKPNWATPEIAGQIIAAVLVGSWDTYNKNDCEKVAYIAGVPYDKFEENLHKWTITDDPPIERIGARLQTVSRQDSWALLSQYISKGVLERFGEVAVDVLGELDPRFDLIPEERWLSAVHGKVTRHSVSLRHGLAEMLAILGSYGYRDLRNIGTTSAEDQVSFWIRQLLIDKMSSNRWGSLAQELPLLAEAAPRIFIEAVEIGLQDDNQPVMSLFVEEGIMGGCLHSGLLWALECLSWNLNYTSQIVRILAKLSRLDPGGRYSNRPFNTLKEIFRGWLPQTRAHISERLRIIDSLFLYEPESSWKLLLNLLPERGGGVSTPIYQPRFHDWATGWEKGVTAEVYRQHLDAIAERILKHVEEPRTRWVDVTKKLSEMPHEYLSKAIIQLEKDLPLLPAAVKDEIHRELSKEVARHREFFDAKWALPKAFVDQIDEICKNLVPYDLVTRYKYLFDEILPALSYPEPHPKYRQKIEYTELKRMTAIQEIWAELQMPGIERLARNAKIPWSLGSVLGKSKFADEIEPVILSWLSNENASIVQTAQAYVADRYAQETEWLTAIHNQYNQTWDPKTWVTFCLSLPLTKTLFDFLESLGAEVKENYWKVTTRYYLSQEEKAYANCVIEHLLSHKRPCAALDAAVNFMYTITKEARLDGNVLARTLEQVLTDPADYEAIPVNEMGANLVKVLTEIQTYPELDQTRIARIEWMCISVFHDNEIQPKALLKEVMQNPDFFVQLICMIYVADPPTSDEFPNLSAEQKKQQALNAWYLLKTINQLPGQLNPTDIDKNQLQKWILRVREGCSRKNRKEVCDNKIGELLSLSPVGKDGVWPHEAIRDVIERFESSELEIGLETGRYNLRGVTGRAWKEGGEQERKIAEQYEHQAEKIKFEFPRTNAVLLRLAQSYRRDAVFWDERLQVE